MDKENVVQTYTRILFSFKKERNTAMLPGAVGRGKWRVVVQRV